ncbi:alpha/beta fold hydrolase [Streptacidiphilus melanogenes]|uniref:alpha/beta fold hydrolase n=1 Tax=Streptacidiphilus melanogenes TaxID=411235 RepID=UPI0005A6663E|nr:alpha/beta hydrolase [Streptacidiphilus melanogenes]
MPRAQVNGIELEYDTFGTADRPTLLMIMGLGSQMIAWDERLCHLLADEGFHVVRYDNRDAGLSTFLDTGPQPDLAAVLDGDGSSATYLVADLAGDAAGLLDALGVERAHLVGASLGGMIAQQLVIDRPERVLSLCSIMSSPDYPRVGPPSEEVWAVLTQPRAEGRDAAIEGDIASARAIGSPGYPREEQELRASVIRTYDRCSRIDGIARQLAAVFASPDRTRALAAVTAPTLVVHGEDDALVDISGGRATAAAVPHAELLTLPGMGHELPEALWPRVVAAIAANARAGEALQAG